MVGQGFQPAVASQPAYTVPAQFISKVYTEGLGMAPPGAQWAYMQNYWLSNPCTAASLADFGKQIYKSTDLNWAYPIPDTTVDKHLYAARTVALFRGGLNREPTQSEFDSVWLTLLNTSPQTEAAVQASWNNVVDNIFNTASGSAFSTLAADICNGNATTPDPADYGWNSLQVEPVLNTQHGVTCGVGNVTRAQLQAALDAAGPGGVVKLSQSTNIWLDAQLIVPEGVTLTTCGPSDDISLPDPIRNRYAVQGRLIRTWTRVANGPDVTWPYDTTGLTAWDVPTVRLLRGAKLDKVWVDGNRNRTENQCSWGVGHALTRTCHNVVMHHVDRAGNILCPGQDFDDVPNCPHNTSVTNSRLDNSAGGTTLSSYGGFCRADNYITNNLITAYASSHQGGHHMDGMTVACEKTNIMDNIVIDATDVPIILWRPCVNSTSNFNENECWTYWTDNRVQRSKIERNTVIAAGSTNWGGIWHTTDDSDMPESPVADFTGATIKDNHIFTSVTATMHALVVLGARTIAPPATATNNPDWSTRATGAIVTNNDTGGQIAYVNVSVIESGMLNVNLSGNHFDLTRVAFAGVGGLPSSFPGWRCGAGYLQNNAAAPIIAEASSAQGTYFWASGVLGPNDNITTLDMGATSIVNGAEQGCMRLDV